MASSGGGRGHLGGQLTRATGLSALRRYREHDPRGKAQGPLAWHAARVGRGASARHEPTHAHTTHERAGTERAHTPRYERNYPNRDLLKRMYTPANIHWAH